MERDRELIVIFLRYYLRLIGNSYNSDLLRYPEEEKQTPPDQRIDAIYPLPEAQLHLEHTSVDLIESNQINKRSLDPGFLLLEKKLKQISCPKGRGVRVTLPLEYAENIAALKLIIPAIKNQVEIYISNAAPSEWEEYPPRYYRFCIEDRMFSLLPSRWPDDEVSLQYSGSKGNYLDPLTLEARIAEKLTSKFLKLDKSMEHAETCCYGIILVDTNDIAAQSFHSFAGAFARLIDSAKAGLSELWGMHGTKTIPTLVWYDGLDLGRTDCPYADDSTGRVYAQIEEARFRTWKSERLNWLERNAALYKKVENDLI